MEGNTNFENSEDQDSESYDKKEDLEQRIINHVNRVPVQKNKERSQEDYQLEIMARSGEHGSSM